MVSSTTITNERLLSPNSPDLVFYYCHVTKVYTPGVHEQHQAVMG